MFDFIGRQMVCAGLLGLGGMVALSGLAGAEPQRGGGGGVFTRYHEQISILLLQAAE